MGKKTKQDKRRRRQERQEAERRAERRRNLITVGIVAGIVVVGGALVWASLDDDPDPLQDLDTDDLDVDELDEGEEPDDPGAAPDDGADDEDTGAQPGSREVACDGEEPPAADEDKPTFDEPDEVLAGVEGARAHMATSCGEIVLDLDLERAPQAANSFAFLAEEGFFDGLEFFRSRPGLDMVQSGAGDNTATWELGYTLPAELAAAEDDGYPPGAVALAVPEDNPEAGGSQFFMIYGDAFMDALAAGALSAEYPRFATIADGLEVVQRIGDLEVGGPNDDRPAQRVYIESVEIEAA